MIRTGAQMGLCSLAEPDRGRGSGDMLYMYRVVLLECNNYWPFYVMSRQLSLYCAARACLSF